MGGTLEWGASRLASPRLVRPGLALRV